MGWVIVASWVGAAVLALLVLGFCAYEVFWKARRLQTEVGRLSTLTQQLAALNTAVAATRQRIIDAVPTEAMPAEAMPPEAMPAEAAPGGSLLAGATAAGAGSGEAFRHGSAAS